MSHLEVSHQSSSGGGRHVEDSGWRGGGDQTGGERDGEVWIGRMINRDTSLMRGSSPPRAFESKGNEDDGARESLTGDDLLQPKHDYRQHVIRCYPRGIRRGDLGSVEAGGFRAHMSAPAFSRVYTFAAPARAN